MSEEGTVVVPPTKLSSLIGSCRSAEDTVAKLREGGLLSHVGDDAEVLRLLPQWHAEHEAHRRLHGPWEGFDTAVARKLSQGGYLSEKGRHWARPIPFRPPAAPPPQSTSRGSETQAAEAVPQGGVLLRLWQRIIKR